MRLFLDANVLFSAAHNPHGNSRALFQLAVAGRCRLVSSRYAADEARRNIARKFPACSGELTALLAAVAFAPEPTPAAVARAAGHGLPAKDAPILAAAIVSRSAVLVTGDRRDLGALFGKIIDGVEILPPGEAVHAVLG
jgi:predicted nucleic acid-binding protein